MKKKHFIGIDLFSGAGGMSLGASEAGIEVKYAIEKDKYAAETYKCNHKGTIVINDDIHNIHDLSLEKGYPVIVFGGPPCQGFLYQIGGQIIGKINRIGYIRIFSALFVA